MLYKRKIGMRICYIQEAQSDTESIVLVDEIETHLHLELQKKIIPILIKMFYNICLKRPIPKMIAYIVMQIISKIHLLSKRVGF